MSSNGIQSPITTVVRHRLNESNRSMMRIRSIFLVAVAIGKFQRFESDKFKKSIECTFDKKTALDELKALYSTDKAFYRKEFVQLTYYVRKFALTLDDLSVIRDLLSHMFQHLNDGIHTTNATDQRRNYFLCLSLKYLVRNSEWTGQTGSWIAETIQLIRRYPSDSIQSELVLVLAHLIAKSHETLGNELKIELTDLVLGLAEVSQEVKAFFFSQLESNQLNITGSTQGGDVPKFKSLSTSRSLKKNQQVVTKTIQAVKTKINNKKSEETDFKFLDLSECMKNRNRKLNSNVVIEQLETIDDKSGDDRSIWRNTWDEVINLYSLVSQGAVLKTDDKDNYVPGRRTVYCKTKISNPFTSFFSFRQVSG